MGSQTASQSANQSACHRANPPASQPTSQAKPGHCLLHANKHFGYEFSSIKPGPAVSDPFKRHTLQYVTCHFSFLRFAGPHPPTAF